MKTEHAFLPNGKTYAYNEQKNIKLCGRFIITHKIHFYNSYFQIKNAIRYGLHFLLYVTNLKS